MSTFAAIDFETANNERTSACALGVVLVDSGVITQERMWFINPEPNYFADFNVMIHGITPKRVARSPKFPEVWKKAMEFIGGRPWAAHFAAFDVSVIRRALDYFDEPYPEASYYCSLEIARRVWPGMSSYSLPIVAKHLSFSFNHHDALEDAKACARVILAALEISGADDLEQLLNQHHLRVGLLENDGYRPCGVIPKPKSSSANSLTQPGDDLDENHPCFGKKFVITGTLFLMKRQDAKQEIVNFGGIPMKQVSKKTNYLILGKQDSRRLVDGKKSNAIKTAEELIAKGAKLEIISEDDFYRMIG